MSYRKFLLGIALLVLLAPPTAHGQLKVTGALQAAKEGAAKVGEKRASDAAGQKKVDGECKVSRDPVLCNTALQWYLPEDAIKLARHHKKLLMVLHLSGNFEKQAFT